MARKDRDMPDGVKTPTSFSTVDEQSKAAAKKAAAPKKPESPVEAALGRDIGKSTATKETAAQRLARIAAEREKTQSGDNPDNPMPTEDPGPGMYWANFGGVWRKYKSPDTSGGGGGGNGGGGGGGGGGGNNTNALTTPTDLKTDAQIAAETLAAGQKAERQSAYDLLFQQFNQYGLGALVEPLKGLITSGASPAEFTIRLRETDAYKKRFAANAARIAKGLTAISEAEYIGLEDQYQNIMRNYGLPANYYTRGDMGRQEGFEKFIGNDVSAAELEDRIMTAQNRVMNANPEVIASLRQFYPDISNGDILAYTLDPDKGLSEIKRKVTAAEIGGGAMQAGLGITGARAEELGAAGITKQQAQQGFQTVAEVAPRGGQLAAIYGESPYTQQTAEQEVFGLAGSTEAAKQRKKLVGLERAAFSGQTGAAQGALGRERAGNL